MMATKHWLRALKTVVASAGMVAVVVMSGSVGASAAGSTVPFHDTNVVGGITFCDRNNHPVTSGSLKTVPFVWKSISSSPPPANYGGKNGRVTLTAYQPMKFIDPGDWSGEQLTGSSSFSNTQHPVAQATSGDRPLQDFVQAYPPHWDGLVQIRFLYSGVNLPPLDTPYPAAVIKVTGGRWTLVQGGSASCNQGTGVDDETKLLPKKRFPTTQSGAAGSGRTNSSSGSPSPGGSLGSNNGSNSSGTSSNAADSSSAGTGLSSGAKTGIGLGVLAVLGVLVGLVMWWRGRPDRT